MSRDLPPGVDPVLAGGLSFAAGASVSLLLVGLALLVMKKTGPNIVIYAFVMFECIRGIVGFVINIVNHGAWSTLTAGFGEIRFISRAFGGPEFAGVILSWIELGIPILAVWYIFNRYPKEIRIRDTIAIFTGLLAGVVLWVLAAGPLLLPFPS